MAGLVQRWDGAVCFGLARLAPTRCVGFVCHAGAVHGDDPFSRYRSHRQRVNTELNATIPVL